MINYIDLWPLNCTTIHQPLRLPFPPPQLRVWWRRSAKGPASNSFSIPGEAPRSFPYKPNPLYYKNREPSNKRGKTSKQTERCTNASPMSAGIMRIRRADVCRWKWVFFFICSGVWDWREPPSEESEQKCVTAIWGSHRRLSSAFDVVTDEERTPAKRRRSKLQGFGSHVHHRTPAGAGPGGSLCPI